MVSAEDSVYLFTQILVIFQLRVPGGHSWTEDYAFVQNFNSTELVDEVDLAFNRG